MISAAALAYGGHQFNEERKERRRAPYLESKLSVYQRAADLTAKIRFSASESEINLAFEEFKVLAEGSALLTAKESINRSFQCYVDGVDLEDGSSTWSHNFYFVMDLRRDLEQEWKLEDWNPHRFNKGGSFGEASEVDGTGCYRVVAESGQMYPRDY